MDIKAEDKATALHVLFALIAAIISLKLSAMLATSVAILLLVACGRATQKIFHKENDLKWWLANGIYPYIIFWLFFWLLLANIL